MPKIHVEDEALNDLKNALTTAGQSYKSSLANLTNFIEEITSGDIQGDPANDLLAKYQAKQDIFNKITQTIFLSKTSSVALALIPSMQVSDVIQIKLTIAPYSKTSQITKPIPSTMRVAIGFAARNIPIIVAIPLPPRNP